MQSMMDYVLGRTNANGMVEGMTGDWGIRRLGRRLSGQEKENYPLSKSCSARVLETMALCAGLAAIRQTNQV